MATPNPFFFFFFFIFFLVSLSGPRVALARVPPEAQFRYVNEGDIADRTSEYFSDFRALPVLGAPFQLVFYNTTPNAYTLAIRMAVPRYAIRRWVWEANRGRPVRDNATVSLGADGDLVLADADGTVVWTSGTANRGVVGIRILPNGNMVLYDGKGGYLWQSFDYPTDTLLVGQSLPCRGAAKLVSRTSAADGSPGRYSLGVDNGEPILYVAASPRPLVYYNRSRDARDGYRRPPGGAVAVKFTADRTKGGAGYELRFGFLLARTKYNSTLSLLRLTPDGDVIVYTYDEPADSRAWRKVFTLFTAGPSTPDQCFKPGRCWPLGLCDGDRCVGCPGAAGTRPWSRGGCAPPPPPGACGPGASPRYYKVGGVESFVTRYSDGEGTARTMEDCRRRCSTDCDCRGFFYWEESSRCWLAPVLGTIKKVAEPRHVLYIKDS